MPNLFHLVERAARVAKHRTAVGHGSRAVLTFGQLADRAERLAGALAARSLKAGDRVALIMANSPDYVLVLCACWRAGFVPVPINAKLHVREFTYMLDHSGARVVVMTPDLASAASEAAATAGVDAVLEVGSAEFDLALAGEPFTGPTRSPDDLAWLFYTSGTTGRPKGAMLTHANLMAMGLSYFVDIDQIAPTDCIIHAAPMSHGSGLYIVPHLMAMAAQVIPESGGFHPDELLSLFGQWNGASMFTAPTMVGRLVDHGATARADLSGLKTIIYGGAPMDALGVERALDGLGPRLAQLYGQGESPMCITGLSKRWYADRSHPRWREIIGSVGFPQSVVSVQVQGEDGGRLPPGEIGEICVRGQTVMAGYWRDEAASAETLRDGWLRTGDVGAFNEDGFLRLLDRSKDLIISGGSNIYPREVEEVLLHHPAVAEASVIGVPHADWGEQVVACIVTRGEPVPEAELDALCRDHIARFKRPKRYVAMETLPKSAYGKILKRELRERLS